MNKLRQALIDWATDVVDKLREITTSAKFWTFAFTALSAFGAYLDGKITATVLIITIAASGMTYMGAKAYEDGHTVPSAH